MSARTLKWIYALAVAAASFSGVGQLPILKRYYITDLPLMGWAANFVTLSTVHYVSVAVLIGLIMWRLASRAKVRWGPLTWWGWGLLGLLAVTGAVKMLRNVGVYFPPPLIVTVNLTHMFSGMAFMFTAIAAGLARVGKS